MSASKTATSTRRSIAACSSWLWIGLICAICALAPACSSTGIKAMPDPVAPPPPPPPPSVPPSLRQPCPSLPPAASDQALVLLANHDQVTELYRDCAGSKAKLVLAVEEFERTAAAWYCSALQRLDIRNEACTDGRPKAARSQEP